MYKDGRVFVPGRVDFGKSCCRTIACCPTAETGALVSDMCQPLGFKPPKGILLFYR
jgi:hypothetical protein